LLSHFYLGVLFMNNKPISIIIAGTVLGSLITTTSYADWSPPTDACVEARVDLSMVMDVIQSCKAFLPDGPWICEPDLFRPDATVMKKDCLALVRYECRSDFPEPKGPCDPDELNVVLEQPECPSVVGTWAVSLDTNCDGAGDINRTNIYHDDFTWSAAGFLNGGAWTQDEDCDIEMTDVFFTPSLIWNGALSADGNTLSDGTYSGAFSGCWTATRLTPPPANGLSLPASTEEELRPSDEYYEED
jgi:hypothetical protein